jgi:hypothetical protein
MRSCRVADTDAQLATVAKLSAKIGITANRLVPAWRAAPNVAAAGAANRPAQG